MSRPAPRRLGVSLERLAVELAPATPLARVQTIWETAAGPTIAAAARPVAQRDGVLTLLCCSSVWAQELDLLADDLLGRLNAALGEQLLHGLRCRAG